MKQNNHQSRRIFWCSVFSLAVAFSSTASILAVEQNDGTESTPEPTQETEPVSLPSPESEETAEPEQIAQPETSVAKAEPSYTSIARDSQMQSENMHLYRSNRLAIPIQSYLNALSDGRFERVEFFDDSYYDYDDQQMHKTRRLVIEHYDRNFQFLDGKEIDSSSYVISGTDLFDCIWGGYYSGDRWNFIVTGQENREQDNNKPVLRVTRYTKEWEYSAHLEITNGEVDSFFDSIYIPFDAGSCRMAEDNGKLWIRMARTMYEDDNKIHHQANYTVCVNEDDMSLNFKGDPLYASHSFNQFIQIYDGKVYTVDLGDAFPYRAVMLGSISDEEIKDILKISGKDGDNNTGVSLGDFQIGNNGQSFLITGTSVDQETAFQSGKNRESVYNGFIKIISGSITNEPKTIWLTDYAKDGKICADNPYLVKLNENKFAVLWESHTLSPYKYSNSLNYFYMDADGNKLSDVYTMEGELSECHPIIADNRIFWYSTGSDWVLQTVPTFYEINVIDNSTNETPRHFLTHYDEEDSTPWETGMKEHWKCTKCMKLFLDAEGKEETTEEALIIPKKPNWNDAVFTFSDDGKSATATRTDENSGKTETVDAEVMRYLKNPATCTENGTSAYYATAEFSDGSSYNETTYRDDIPAGHDLVHHEAKLPTYYESGNKEYWYCSRCGKYFLDEKAEKETTLEEVTLSPKEAKYYSLNLSVESLGSEDVARIGLYGEFWTDDNIKDDLEYAASNASIGPSQTGSVEQSSSGLYDQNFIFNHVMEGNYRLAIRKSGYLVHIENISITRDENLGIVSLRAYGDVNNDKQINITDILSVRDHVIGKTVLLGENAEAADVPINGKKDDAVNIRDILQIRDRVIGKVDESYY